MKPLRMFDGRLFCLWSIAILLLLAASGLNAQVTASGHVFNSAAPDANKYGLDMSQDGIPPGNYLYCRWGVLSDHWNATGLPFTLQFDYLTQSPYSQESKDLYILNSSQATDQFLFSFFPTQWPLPSPASSWTTPTGPSGTLWDPLAFQSGTVKPASPQSGSTYYLFRKYHFSPVLFEWKGPNLQPRLSQDASKLVIMVHGWNRTQKYDYYQQDADFVSMGAAIYDQAVGTDWKVVGYHWEADADAGAAAFGDRPSWGPLNGAEAAEAGYLHGLHLGEVLHENFPQLKKVHLVAHSAGTWCARTVAKYLLQRNPEIVVQITLLDPYIPGAVSPSVLDPVYQPASSLNATRINELLGLSHPPYLMENYFSDDGATVVGTQELLWGGGGVEWSSAINKQVGSFPLSGYHGHGGPITFFTDTVNNTLASPPPVPADLAAFGSELPKLGWWRSMFLNEPIIDQQPVSIPDAAQGSPVSFTVHSTTRRQQRGYPASGLTLSYHWQKYDDATATWQTAFGSSGLATYSRSATVAEDAGQYRVIANNGTDEAISQVFTLNFNATAGSPQIAIQSPAAGTVSGVVTVSTTVSDAVAKVEFFLDGLLVATDTTTPFSWSWNTLQTTDAPHALTAQAYGGLTETLLGISTPVAVTVNNAAPPTCSDPNEPNDSSLTATPLAFGVAANGYVCTAADVDWFRVDVTTPGVLTFDLTVPASTDYELELFGPNAAYIKGSYRDTGLAENITHNATVTGTYWVRVYGYPVGNGSHNTTTPFTLTAAVVSGPVSILTPPQNGRIRTLPPPSMQALRSADLRFGAFRDDSQCLPVRRPALRGQCQDAPPQNRAVPVGASASFSVTASGAPPLAYQWQQSNNGGSSFNDIPGATGPTYATPVLTLADSGAQFRVRVTNAFGFTLSAPATLTVNTANVITWTGATGNGNWFNRTNWNPMTVPTASDVVQLNSASLNVPAGAVFAVMNLNGGALSGTFTNTGTLNWTSGTLRGQVVNGAGGVLVLAGASDKIFQNGGAQVFNDGVIRWSGAGKMLASGDNFYGNIPFENRAGGLWEISSDSATASAGGNYPPSFIFTNQGTMRKIGGQGVTSFGLCSFNNSGTVEVQAGTLAFTTGFAQSAGVTRLAGGSLSGGTFNFTGGTLSGSGIITAAVVNGAIVRPGVSPGTLTINGNYTQTIAGVLQMELGGLTPGSGFDRLVVNGQVTLAGALQVAVINGFTPAFSDAFPVLIYASRSGSFASVNLPALPNVLALTSQYSPNAMTLLTANTTGNNATNTLAAVATGTGPLELRFTGVPGSAYRLQASTNLIDWVNVFTNTPVNGLIRFVDPDAVSIDHRFYRAVSP